MKILAKVIHGSKLYGLDGPKSDTDLKLIHLPSKEDCLLMRPCRNQNIKGDNIESESFALQEWLKLAGNGESIVLDMLHAPEDKILETSPTWEVIRAARKSFYTKKMSGSAGYCRGMAAKYALRADRMDTVLEVIKVLEGMLIRGVGRLSQAWGELPVLPHTRFFENPADRGVDKRIYEVAGKGLPATIAPAYALEILTKVRDSYGERVRAAREMDSIDLKALSHSFRVGYQLKHIYVNGGYAYPLPESSFIKDVKYGRLSYVDDRLDEKLNDLITEVEALSAASTYPETVDRGWIDSLILEAYSA